MKNITNITNITNIKYKLFDDKIFIFYYEYKYAILIGLIFGSISSIISSYIPLLYSKILKILLNDNLENKKDNINNYIISYIIYKFISNLFAGLRGYIFTIYIHKISINLKKNILSEFFDKDLSYLNAKTPIYKIDLLTNNCKSVADLYSISTNMIVRNIVHFITISYILINKSFFMYIICVFLASIQYITDNTYNKYFYQNSVEKTNKNENDQRDIITDYINKIETYRSLGLEKKLLIKIKKLQDYSIILKNKEAFYYGFNFITMTTFNSSIVCVMIYYGKYLNINYKNIYEFIIYTSEIINIIKEILIAKKDFMNNKLPLKKINEVYNINYNKWGNFINKKKILFHLLSLKIYFFLMNLIK